MALAEELREIAAILEMPSSPFHREGAQLRAIARRFAQVEERAERAERAAEQWEHAHNYAARELEELAAALQARTRDARAPSTSSDETPSRSTP